ncbi:Methyltransferase type 12 [hydrothermal vent metagenome]|uniref:Methyltransferase type 12 n=1 Tax=hydrothermal vent metagenome TaxID=652676 RepID=A0A3B1D5C3_9ZZZZ
MNNDSSITLESKPCPLGCSGEDHLVLIGRDRLQNLPGEFTILECNTCGLMRTNPRPTPESMGFYYPDSYGPYQGTRVDLPEQTVKILLKAKQLAKRLFEFNTFRLPILPAGRMLEVGCASGAFLHQMAGKGWDVEGLEFSSKAAERARVLGYSVCTSTIEDAPDPKKTFDLIVGWMVLEHLHHPVLALQKLHRWTKKGGWLVVSLPNPGSLEFRLFKDKWYALHLPNHLYHYTVQTFDKILEKSGWQLKEIHHQRIMSNLIGSLGYLIDEQSSISGLRNLLLRFPEKAGVLHCLLFPIAYLLSTVGQTGRMTVWARRKE